MIADTIAAISIYAISGLVLGWYAWKAMMK